MKNDFSQPRFNGSRFDEHTLPVDVARDLAAYEALIIELAKQLYLRDHLNRQRVPKGFASNVHLAIERIDEGSARPMLALVMNGALALVGGERSYFEQARDLVGDCIAASPQALPESFPRELLHHFNQLGRSLRDDETLELPRSGMATAVLTQDKRRQLVLAADRVYEKEVDLAGFIAEVDFEKSTFRLRLPDGRQVAVPMPDAFQNKVREFAGKTRHQITLKGVAAFDSWDKLQKVVAIEALDVIKNHVMATRVDELVQLQPGWFEGQGKALDPDRFAEFADKLVASYPDILPLPDLIPTQQGNLLLEWEADGDPSLDIHLPSLQASFHAFARDGKDVERDFALDQASGWQELFSFLNDSISAGAT